MRFKRPGVEEDSVYGLLRLELRQTEGLGEILGETVQAEHSFVTQIRTDERARGQFGRRVYDVTRLACTCALRIRTAFPSSTFTPGQSVNANMARA
jgi:hypothetical protein